jgi:hypothetical protein
MALALFGEQPIETRRRAQLPSVRIQIWCSRLSSHCGDQKICTNIPPIQGAPTTKAMATTAEALLISDRMNDPRDGESVEVYAGAKGGESDEDKDQSEREEGQDVLDIVAMQSENRLNVGMLFPVLSAA